MKECVAKFPLSNFQTSTISKSETSCGDWEVSNFWYRITIAAGSEFYFSRGVYVKFPQALTVTVKKVPSLFAVWVEDSYLCFGVTDRPEPDILILAYLYKYYSSIVVDKAYAQLLNGDTDVFVAALFRLHTNQNIPSNTLTTLAFRIQDYNAGIPYNYDQYFAVIPVTGIYQITLKVATAGDWTTEGGGYIGVYVNDERMAHANLQRYMGILSREIILQQSSKISCRIYQITGETKTLYMQSDLSWFSIRLLKQL